MVRPGRPQERGPELGAAEGDEPERISGPHSTAPGLVRRAQIILASAAQESSTAMAARPGVSAQDLADKITAFVEAYGAKARPFVRTATGEAILAKIERPRSNAYVKLLTGQDTRSESAWCRPAPDGEPRNRPGRHARGSPRSRPCVYAGQGAHGDARRSGGGRWGGHPPDGHDAPYAHHGPDRCAARHGGDHRRRRRSGHRIPARTRRFQPSRRWPAIASILNMLRITELFTLGIGLLA